jgi:hypothetical protein
MRTAPIRQELARCDEHTRRLLLATIEHPTLLDAADPMFLIDRLQELLRDGMDAPLVASVATAVVAGKAGVRWEGSAGDLVGIALALQRLPETRADGTALFERLMEAGTYEADDALRSLDRRTLH